MHGIFYRKSLYKRLIAFLLSFVLIVSCHAKDKIRISIIQGYPELHSFAERVYSEAYNQFGYDVEIVPMLAERALITANEGSVDGVAGRIAGLSEKYKNLIKIPFVIYEIDVVAYSKKHNFEVQGWESLKPYRIGVTRGEKNSNMKTSKMNRIIVNSPDQMFDMLSLERIDLAITSRVAGYPILKRKQLKDIRVLEPAIEKVAVYHYLNKKHGVLAPTILRALQIMSEEKRLDALWDDYFRHVQYR